MIFAMDGHNIVNSEAFRGSVNTKVFNAFLTATMSVLGQTEEFIFVLDNVNFQHGVTIPDNSNFSRHYCLPPYSSILNPCEEAFALIKSNVRRRSPPSDTRDFISRMNDATCNVIPRRLENFIMHSESFYGACLNLEDIGRK
ncbi:hypothetical protein RF11_11572 [Thelohanellus kitauei]|uniref:Tc1-like transposase DDE domain-containing protein n=1 Tax=Thelohanellus kitauei TaxID=669202 RepID=A0A0C2MWW0_THEKT|nr:hypothetical protein RF11_11572 [Thelohanellus kitauei]